MIAELLLADGDSFTVKPGIGLIIWTVLAVLFLVGIVVAVVMAIRSR